MIHFEHPILLYLLLLIPAFVALYVYLRLSRRKRAGAFAESRLYALLTPDVSNIKSHTKFAILMAALFLLIIAVANPQMGSKMVKGERAGIDVAIALDISNSMLAEDVQPNRLERAKKSVSDLIGKFSNDRVALIIFAGKAYTQLPLTSDYGAAKMFLDAVGTDMIEYQGTAIGEAITKCMETFGYGNEDIPWEKNKSRTIIIISDGENHEDDAVEMAKMAYAEGIVVNTIGMGTPNGVPIPQYSRGTRLGYKKDREGNPVTTRLNEQMLQEIAHAGNGIYVPANNISSGLDDIMDRIGKLEKQNYGEQMFAEYESKFQYPLIFAILLLVAELLIFERRNRIFNYKNIFGKNTENR
ncbi:MAG: VWA domain-containing protein [Bacteroidales bacterium]|nr:VWA domain-containing protein [Bacteroidales bacterium]